MTLNLSVDEVLTTTRSVRKRLDLEKPVPREVLMECLDLALQAPTGSNAQGWQWVFVDDPEKKKAIADIYRHNATPYLDQPKPECGDVRDEQTALVTSSAKYLNEHLHEVPVMMIPCLEGRPGRRAGRQSAGSGARCCPRCGASCWRCARAASARRGRRCTSSARARSWPPKSSAFRSTSTRQGGLFPIAYTKGTDFRRAKRLPAEQFAHWNSW